VSLIRASLARIGKSLICCEQMRACCAGSFAAIRRSQQTVRHNESKSTMPLDLAEHIQASLARSHPEQVFFLRSASLKAGWSE
jgi:hypothetical protein